MEQKITITVKIATDGEYCEGLNCEYASVERLHCNLFNEDTPFVGGRLRCKQCLAAEQNKIKVKAKKEVGDE